MVLSEPFGRIEGRTTYGTVPPRKRPALGRRYRPEQDFSSGLRRRDDRRTGASDPCSAALYGRVLKASSSSKTIPVIGERTAMNIPEPKIVIEDREHLWILLSEALQLEHMIMCQYLFAQFSLKDGARDGLTAEQAGAVDRWRAIAIEEMLHMALVANLMSAIGAAPYFGRPNFPQRSGYFPEEVRLDLLR